LEDQSSKETKRSAQYPDLVVVFALNKVLDFSILSECALCAFVSDIPCPAFGLNFHILVAPDFCAKVKSVQWMPISHTALDSRTLLTLLLQSNLEVNGLPLVLTPSTVWFCNIITIRLCSDGLAK
jgi:hypothetical protein